MRRRALAHLVALTFMTVASASRADPPVECRFRGQPPITPAQLNRLGDLDIAIRSLRNHDNCGPLHEKLRRLLDEPCFRVLKNISPLPACGSGELFRDWWDDGGRLWVASARRDRGEHSVLLPPSIPRVLNLDGNERHALAPLLCRVGDPTCGQETRGWIARFEQTMSEYRMHDQLVDRHQQDPNVYCGKVRRDTPAARYAAWRECAEEQRHKLLAFQTLPGGPFKAPADGWLVVRGRRGHYTFCDGLAAFDLATGAAYVARRCSDLGILPPTDADAIERRKTGRLKVVAERGRVSVENLREAALMLFLWPERQEMLPKMEFELVAGIEVSPLPAGFALTKVPFEELEMSGDTWLAWDWSRGRAPSVSGKVLYPEGGRLDPTGYPTGLLEIVEAGLQPGCPPAALPSGIFARGSPFGGVSPIDASRADLDAAEAELARALTDPAPGCGPAQNPRLPSKANPR